MFIVFFCHDVIVVTTMSRVLTTMSRVLTTMSRVLMTTSRVHFELRDGLDLSSAVETTRRMCTISDARKKKSSLMYTDFHFAVLSAYELRESVKCISCYYLL